MPKSHLKPTGARHNAASAGITGGLTYAEVMRDPRLMERLLRDARRARSEAIYRLLAAAYSASRRSISRVSLGALGVTALSKLSTRLPLRSIRYLWKFQRGAAPVRCASAA